MKRKNAERLKSKLFRNAIVGMNKRSIRQVAKMPQCLSSDGASVKLSSVAAKQDPLKEFEYDVLSEFEKARFHRRKLQNFNVNRKMNRLATLKSMPDLRHLRQRVRHCARLDIA
jgi:hypothetical protein